MYFHAACGIVLYFVVCKLYANKEKKDCNEGPKMANGYLKYKCSSSSLRGINLH